MNPFSPGNLGATLLTIIICGTVITIALLILITAGDDGGVHWPRWPARYPARPRGPIYGDMRARLAAALLVDDGRWTARCERHGWGPGDEEEQART